MSMKPTDVQRIAVDVARELDDAVEVVAAVPTTGDSAYTEVVLTIRGCQDEPCVVVVGVSRDASESSIRVAVAEQMRGHLRDHRSRTAGAPGSGNVIAGHDERTN
jgi:hypothetical protein